MTVSPSEEGEVGAASVFVNPSKRREVGVASMLIRLSKEVMYQTRRRGLCGC